jgi:dethiobiotin synthetase
MLEDLWPGVTEFHDIKELIEDKKEVQSNSSEKEETGSVQFAKRRAEKIRAKEEKARKQFEQEQIQSSVEDDLPEHDWLVE